MTEILIQLLVFMGKSYGSRCYLCYPLNPPLQYEAIVANVVKYCGLFTHKSQDSRYNIYSQSQMLSLALVPVTLTPLFLLLSNYSRSHQSLKAHL